MKGSAFSTARRLASLSKECWLGETMAEGYESDEGLVVYLGACYQF